MVPVDGAPGCGAQHSAFFKSVQRPFNARSAVADAGDLAGGWPPQAISSDASPAPPSDVA